MGFLPPLLPPRRPLAAPRPPACLPPTFPPCCAVLCCGQGSIEHGLEQLELYRNLLDNRVVSRFDAALGRLDLGTMAECAAIMAQFPRGEAVLIQRYISTRPIFKTCGWGPPGGRGGGVPGPGGDQGLGGGQPCAGAGKVGAPSTLNPQPSTLPAGEGKVGAGMPGGSEGALAEAAPAGGAPPGDAATALRGLSGLYRSIAGTMRDEAVVLEQVRGGRLVVSAQTGAAVTSCSSVRHSTPLQPLPALIHRSGNPPPERA